jgi:thioredoxin-related protein
MRGEVTPIPCRRVSWSAILDVVTSVVVMAAACALIWVNWNSNRSGAQKPAPVPSKAVPTEGAAAVGSPDAPAVMIVFSDYECPFCGRFARDVVPEIERR